MILDDYGKYHVNHVSTMMNLVNLVKFGMAWGIAADLVGCLHQLLLRIKAAVTKYHWSVGSPTFKTRGNKWKAMQLVLCFCKEPRQILLNASNYSNFCTKMKPLNHHKSG